MNENKHTKSISRKINANNFAHQLSSFIVIDLILFTLSVCIWCYDAETSGGNDPELFANRDFTSVTAMESDIKKDTSSREQAYSMYRSADKDRFTFIFPQSFENLLMKSVYVYYDDNDKAHYVYSGGFMTNLFSCLYITLAVEAIILLSTAVTGAARIRRYLAPLDELAFKAHVLSNTTDFDQQAFTELENAINAISPAKEGAKVHTGNAEMVDLENSINSLLDRMRDSYRQQSRFVSDASHELRTPLAVLQGYVNMLDRWGKNDEKILEESIEAIKSETEHMKKLVEQLLFLARGDSGRTKLTMKNFSLNDMMLEVYEESSMIDTDHRYTFKPSPESITVYGDVSMLKQTARILLDNAAKYTPEGAEIVLKTTISDNEDPAFVIQDEGIGIAGSDVPHVFERFFRSDPARNKDGGGTGLGLSIAKWIIDKHGGYFNVLSREDIGTRITVCLPRSI